MSWLKRLKGKVKRNEPLSKHTTFRIGGRVSFLIEPKDTADLKELISGLKKENTPIRLIGSGSNLLAGDGKVDGAVIRLSAPFFKKIRSRNNILEAGGGATLSSLLQYACVHNLAGLEFLAGIPGTVGAALVMNAGIPGHNIGDAVLDVAVMDYYGKVKSLKKKDIDFVYRRSGLGKYIVIGARFKLSPDKKSNIQKRIKNILQQRRMRQDYSHHSAGCVFKNPKRLSAGKLIDDCGLKGTRIGGASICDKHANFILNKGNARAADVLKLMALIKNKVKAKFNIKLEPEIKIWR
jgi:UDP-N-acetylmuramate dehydrogenase